MPRWWIPAVVFVATLALFGGVSAADGNEPPLADAGLDQTVDNRTTVYLDAGGSVDPDGAIASVQWSITDPDGNPASPSDPTAIQTEFTPTRTGNYTVDVSVTDDDGAMSDDTLYVTVEESEGPTVTLTGPSRTNRNEPTEFTVTTSAGDADLRQLHWLENGSNRRTFDLSGDESTVSLNRAFSEPKSYQLDATVYDTRGYSQTSSLRLRVLPIGGRGSGGRAYDHCPDGGSPYFVDGDFIGCNDGGADKIYGDYVLEANSEPGLWLYSEEAGEVVQMATEEQVEEMQKDPSVPLTVDMVEENYEENLESERKAAAYENAPRRYQNSGSSNSATSSGNASGSPRSSNTGSTSAPSPPVDSVAPSPSPNPTFPT